MLVYDPPRKVRHLLASLLVLGMYGCGADNESPAAAAPPPSTATTAPAPVPSSETATQLAFTKKRVDRVTDMYLEGRLRCDTLPYNCGGDVGAGKVVLCYLGEDLIRGEALSDTPGGVGRETYYYDGEEHYATVLEGTQAGEPAEVRYLYGGNLIDRSGPDREERIGVDRVRQADTDNKSICP